MTEKHHSPAGVLALFFTAILLSAACSSNKSKPPPSSKKNGSAMAEARAGQTIVVAGRKHKVIAFTGYLEIDPYPTGKGVQGTRIYTKDGHGYLLAIRRYRPYLKYANRWVTGTGYHYRSSNDPRAQSIGLFMPVSIRLAPGQKPHATAPTRVPRPPRVRSKAELERLPGRWALLVEKPTYVLEKPFSKDKPSHTVKSVTLTLPPGLSVKKHLWQRMSTQSVQRLLAQKQATLVVRITRYGGKLKVQASKHCEGGYLLCGMERRPKRHDPKTPLQQTLKQK